MALRGAMMHPKRNSDSSEHAGPRESDWKRTSSNDNGANLIHQLSKTRRFSSSVILSEGAAESKCNRVVDSSCFQVVVTCTVICNTIQMGLEADYPGLKNLWIVCENIATSIFFFEMVLKIIAKKRAYFHERANWLDASLTILGMIDCWVLALVPGDSLDLQSMTILRVLRLIRLGRVSKVARKVKAIVLVFTGLRRALETTFWVMVALVAIMFVFAIFCTEYMGRPEEGVYPGFSTDSEVIDQQEVMTNYNPHVLFGSMRTSMLTLFSIAIGSDWSDIMRPLAIKQPIFVVLFLFYCILVVFGLMNVILAIVVENVIDESRKLDQQLGEAERAQKKCLLQRIQGVLNDLDADGDNILDYAEIQAGFAKNSEFQALLNDCDFPAGWNARELLNMLDFNGDGHLEKKEFTTNVFRLLDSSDFQQVCMLQSSINYVKQLVRQSHSRLESQIKDVKEAIWRLQPIQFSAGLSANVHDADSAVGDTRLSLGSEGDVGLSSMPLGRASTRPQVTSLTSLPRSLSSIAERTIPADNNSRRSSGQHTLEHSLERDVQQRRDFLEQTEAIGSTYAKPHAAVDRRQELLAQARSQAASTESMTEQDLLTQATIAACSDAVCRELDHMIKRFSYNDFPEILEASFAAVREAEYKEVTLPAHVEDLPTESAKGTLPQATCTQVQPMNDPGQECSSASHARDEEPFGLQAYKQIRNLSEGVQGALRCCAASQSGRMLRTGEFVAVPLSL